VAKSTGDITIIGTRRANQATIRQLGLEGVFKRRGNLDLGDIEVVNLTPKLMDLIADKTSERLAKALKPQRARRPKKKK